MEQTVEQRLLLLEKDVADQGKDLETQGGTLDHVVKTLDTIVLPTQDAHSKDIIECKQRTQASHDYITRQEGAWAWIQRAIVVIGGVAAVATLIMKLMGK